MKVLVSNAFFRFKKKAPKNLQLEIDEQVKKIMQNPEIGDLKKGELKGIRVHKFTYKTQLYLLSYEIIKDNLNLYMIGTHENFYKRLKNLFY
ncbi:MAG: type II toxin-antitoxin system RelE/ParE family toxin [Candidatus Wallbacteria bacterium]|nr:type II toxin-antitoxin system RelE/ParE family toxin [Candidatus Wallbacteria bacterium]